MPPASGLAVTALGPIRGAADSNGVHRYLGIPYVKPPIGERRWRAPEPTGCYETELSATAFSPECPQYVDGEVEGDEDCLGLNLWTPVGVPDGRSRPVLVFVHGGGHEQGSGSRSVYDGSRLAREHDVVVVTFNYRLGPLGFLAHPNLPPPRGAYGMADQVAALRWVHQHVAAFGGDPERVVVFGESAGAVSVCRLLVSPPARGLFAAAILQSGGCSATPLQQAERAGVEFAEGIGCFDASCLMEQDVASLMAGFEPLGSGTNIVGSGAWGGVVDGEYLTATPFELILRGEQADVPVIVGSNREENGRDAPPLTTEEAYEAAVRALYRAVYSPQQIRTLLEAYPAADYDSPRDAYVAMTSDRRFTCPARLVARALARGSQPVYRYRFAQVPERGGPEVAAAGAFHGLELIYVFGGVLDLPTIVGPGDRAVVSAMQRAWVGIVDGGIPPELGWTPEGQGTVMRFEGGPEVVPDPKAELCDVWESL